MTLPEVLVVVSILSILFALLFMPLIKAFVYVHTGEVRMNAGSVARSAFETVTRELSNAIFIYDNKNDPTESSCVFVLPQGSGGNANMVGGSVGMPILISPGPGLDYNLTAPLVVHYGLGLAKAVDSSGSPMPYGNVWEMENRDVTGGGQDLSQSQVDNFIILWRGEYYPSQDPNKTPDAAALPFLLPSVLGGLYPGQGNVFEPGVLFDNSLYVRQRGDLLLRDSNAAGNVLTQVAQRRKALEDNGVFVPITPREGVDMVWATYAPPATSTGTGSWAAKPGFMVQSKAVQNETLDAVALAGGTYPETYRADYGHWQTVRRPAWAYPAYNTLDAPATPLQLWAPFFQVFDVQVNQLYTGAGSISRRYYVAAGRDDGTTVYSPGGSAVCYYVFSSDDRPVFNVYRYQDKIATWRRGLPSTTALGTWTTFWQNSNPYDTALLSTAAADPYWPEMAYLLDPDHGTVEFRVDAPVRQPGADADGRYDQPDGPLAPYQGPSDFLAFCGAQQGVDQIPDVALAKGSAARFGNGDGTSWIRVPTESVRVMVGTVDLGTGRCSWQQYTRVPSGGDVNHGEFSFDELTGDLTFDSDETGEWLAQFNNGSQLHKIRAWYQIQTNVQRPNTSASMDSADGTVVTAAYYTKEVLRVTVSLRAYDSESGRAHPFQLSATVNPRNLH